MKKVILLAIIVILGFTMAPGSVSAWDDCAKGLVDDPYPGECARYVDTDNDGICDHSQPAPEDREASGQSDGATTDGLVSSPDPNSVERVGSAEAVALVSQNQDNKLIIKLLPVMGMVLFYLTGILLYVAYRKSRVK